MEHKNVKLISRFMLFFGVILVAIGATHLIFDIRSISANVENIMFLTIGDTRVAFGLTMILVGIFSFLSGKGVFRRKKKTYGVRSKRHQEITLQ